ncbi:MAG: hypothetical protein EOP07_21940 [Proteobacteria bacterium]|nr:MAG: hypothetical protein EOP07_21940 [Pseudomonadota bacterium]
MRTLLGLSLLFLTAPLLAEPINLATNLDRAPWISARAAGLGQTLSGNANGLDAYYYNPALIGGFRSAKEQPFLTHLFMPYIGNNSESGSNKIITQQLGGEKLEDNAVSNLLAPAFEGERPYTAASLTPVAIFNRLMAGYTYNSRTAAYRNDDDPALPKIHIDQRTLSGPFIGFSAVAPKNDFYLGVSAAFLKSSTVQSDLDATAFATRDSRKLAFEADKETYEGMPINIGMHYRFSGMLKPNISAVVNDVGSTRFSPADKTEETLIQKEKVTLGLGISPMLKTWGTLNVMLEATDLTQHEIKTRDKFRASTEFTVGDRFGADAGLSFRLGYTSAGMSFGAGINLGILNAQIASFAEDIGADGHRVIERRSVLNLAINIADY